MPRRLRIHLPGGFYHVTLRGNHRQPIFFTDGDRQLLNMIVARALEKFEAQLHAYCWMTNHLHLLVQAGTEPIGRPMHNIASEYARAMQLKLDTTGHFFERRYHATLVDADAYLLELLRYIHLNPVRAGITVNPGQHRWSSHHNYLGARSDSWVSTDFALGLFSADRPSSIAAYQRFLAKSTEEPWEPSLALAAGAAVIGSDEFVARVQRSTQTVRRRQSLDELMAEACQRFEVELVMLDSPVRDAYMTKVRAWIAYQAQTRGIATMAAAARALGRTEGALRHAIRAYPGELE